MQIQSGSNVKWVSSEGTHTGVVTDIVLSPNAENKVIPWINIQVFDTVKPSGEQTNHINYKIRLCGNHDYLIMMKFEII